jgi:uncharacterized membrane protein
VSCPLVLCLVVFVYLFVLSNRDTVSVISSVFMFDFSLKSGKN